MMLLADGSGGIAEGEARQQVAPAMLRRLAAVAALVALLPVLAVTSIVVWLCLGRPLMFRQTRCGLGAKPFTLCKFRTMHDWRDAQNKLLPDADRLTAATRILRLLRLDELPQLLAIAKGDMAFVGPRPLLASTIAEFGELGRVRCKVLPGLSGWAQVNGNTCLTDKEKLALDLWYIENRSFALDCRILAMTILVILKGEHTNDGNLARARSAMHHFKAAGASEERP
jgi:lipopolysaccharide/colanic/teichoic acid biosynthesis glycosyltransferase